MQQFTVPQFIDVEAKIIGPLTVRQFLIVLAAALLGGISYRLFDFSLFITITVILLLLAATFAFVKINARPFHFFFLNVLQTLRRPRLRLWRKIDTGQPLETTKTYDKPEVPVVTHKEFYKKSRLAELALVVDTQGKYKGESADI